jgi:hypothetical protein
MNGGEGLIGPDGYFVGHKPQAYTIAALFGRRSATSTVTLAPRGVRRVATSSAGSRSARTTAELWLHPREKVAYLTTFDGIVYTIDIKDPAKPVIVDSIVADVRLINDVMTSENGRILVRTRQGRATGERPAERHRCVHAGGSVPPEAIAQFVDPVTSGYTRRT